jgi:hypothetical protein
MPFACDGRDGGGEGYEVVDCGAEGARGGARNEKVVELRDTDIRALFFGTSHWGYSTRCHMLSPERPEAVLRGRCAHRPSVAS